MNFTGIFLCKYSRTFCHQHSKLLLAFIFNNTDCNISCVDIQHIWWQWVNLMKAYRFSFFLFFRLLKLGVNQQQLCDALYERLGDSCFSLYLEVKKLLKEKVRSTHKQCKKWTYSSCCDVTRWFQSLERSILTVLVSSDSKTAHSVISQRACSFTFFYYQI